MRVFTKKDIKKLGLRNPIVRAHLDAQRYTRGITFEQMLISLVVHLVEANDAMAARAIDFASRLPPKTLGQVMMEIERP